MRFSTFVVSLCAVFSSLGVGLAAPASAEPKLTIFLPSAVAQALQNQENLKDDTLTLLRFETDDYLVRVYRQEGLTYLNIYNKETGYTDQNGVLAYLVNPDNEDEPWRVYANQQGDLEYRAMVNPQGDTALEIRLPDGPPAPRDYGFNITYSFPHLYLGSNLETTLSELTESGWIVESSSADTVKLTRNQLALDLKFDPASNIITYTHLIDLT
ncbi:MAG: hypothetical protein F6K00_02140 [Leptolyngbya sp. SIOISBB]|nr:hypothetical protein [Leptolyngbya sp. SIOISBB]